MAGRTGGRNHGLLEPEPTESTSLTKKRGYGRETVEMPDTDPVTHGATIEAATDALVENKGNKTAALRQIGYPDPNANGSRFFERPAVKAIVRQKMKGAGIKESLVYKRLREALDYKETKFYRGDKIAECVDNDARLAAVELCLKLMGDVQDGSKQGGDMVQVVFNVIVQAIDAEAPKEVGTRILVKIAQGLKATPK